MDYVLIFCAIAAFWIGMTPTIVVSKPDADDCQHVMISRFWGNSIIVDAVMCDGEPFLVDGENILGEAV